MAEQVVHVDLKSNMHTNEMLMISAPPKEVTVILLRQINS